MTKVFKNYLIIWVVLLIIFNVVSFVSVGWTGQEKYTPSFWIGYAFITLTFIGQIVCAYFALKNVDIKKTFYNIPLFETSCKGVILTFVVGGLCMLISPLPYWIGIIGCSIILLFNIISVVKAFATVDIVSGLDSKLRTQTFFTKSLTIDADTLMASAKSDSVKTECRKVYEAIRYSDPMSNGALASVETQITLKFADLSEAVKADNIEAVTTLANEVCILVADRNKKCKMLK